MASKKGKPNINQASQEQIEQVEGFSDRRAELIVQFREQRGRIGDFDELREIPGFEDTLVEKLRDNFSV